MDRLELQKLRDLPIEGVAERLGLQVVRHKCLCPFHDDHHASLSFSVRRNSYRCFVCGASGGTIDLVMHYLGKPFREACRWLAEGTPLLLPQGGGTARSESLPSGRFGGGRDLSFYARFFERPFLNDEARRFLYDERRIDPRVVRWCRLTSWRDKQGVPWLQIPYYDREGKLIGIQNRNLTPSRPPQGEALNHSPTGDKKSSPRGGLEGVPRFRFPTGSRCTIYNLPVLNLRVAVDHRGLQRLLGHALGRSQSHRHPLGHPPETQGRGTLITYHSSLITSPPHVPRPRRARRTALHATEGAVAHAGPPPAAPRLQGLQRVFSDPKITLGYLSITRPYDRIRVGYFFSRKT